VFIATELEKNTEKCFQQFLLCDAVHSVVMPQ